MTKKWNTYHTQFLKYQYLFRYTKKERIINMLQNQNLYMTRMDRFDDKLEGISTFDITELLTSYKDYFQDDLNDYDGLSPHYKGLVKKDAKERLLKVRQRLMAGQKQHFVSCWYNSNRESDGMWRFYGKENGFAIKVAQNDFQKSLKESVDINATVDGQFVVAGKIRYQDFPNVIKNEETNSVLYLAFRKDIAFAHENEYRLVFVNQPKTNRNHISYQIKNFSSLFFTIICHPAMEHNEYLKVKEELETYRDNVCVKKSELEPFYQLFSRTKNL